MKELRVDEQKAVLRDSKFAPLPPLPSQPRQAHPGGALKTNKAAALSKFLKRKLDEPGGLTSLNTDLLTLAIKNAKASCNASGTLNNGRIIRHVESFDDEDNCEALKPDKKKKKKRKKKKKKKAINGSSI